MLVPTARVEKSLSWHFLFNEDQSRISYQEARQQCPSRTTVDVVNASLLENKRHFLGWASEVEQQTGRLFITTLEPKLIIIPKTGTKNCKYEEIDWPTGDGCEFAGSGIALDKMSLSVGKIASVGASAARGIKDTPGYLIGAMTYSQEIRDARNIQVVLYDLGDQRGWLGKFLSFHIFLVGISQEQNVSQPLHHYYENPSPLLCFTAFPYAG